MGAPNSEVGYTSAITRRGATKPIWTCDGIGAKKKYLSKYRLLFVTVQNNSDSYKIRRRNPTVLKQKKFSRR
jgi:hypothetical protein